MKRKNCPTCSFFNLINRQMCTKINRKVAFFILYSKTKESKYSCHPPFHPPIFCHHSLKLLSPTLPKLMNWILLSPPPLSSDPATPPKIGTCTRMAKSLGVSPMKIQPFFVCLICETLRFGWYCLSSLMILISLCSRPQFQEKFPFSWNCGLEHRLDFNWRVEFRVNTCGNFAFAPF